MTEKQFFDRYGVLPSGNQLEYVNKNTLRPPNPTEMRRVKGTSSVNLRNYKDDLKKIENEQKKSRKEIAKKWLNGMDLTCFEKKGRHEYTEKRYEIIAHLHDRLGLTFKDAGEILTEAVGRLVTMNGMNFIYHYTYTPYPRKKKK